MTKFIAPYGVTEEAYPWRLDVEGNKVHIWFNQAHSKWFATDGLAVCSDHAHPAPCPFH